MKWIPITEIKGQRMTGAPYWVLRADGHKEIVKYRSNQGCWHKIDGTEFYHDINMHFDYFCPDVVVPDEVRLGLGNGWISVEEKIPETNDKVLVILKDDLGKFLVDTSEFYGVTGPRKWTCLEYYDDSRVTHWMPFPELPDMEYLK